MSRVADTVAAALREAGVARVFGASLPGLHHIAVDDPSLASLLADADGRLGPAAGAALLPDGTLRISSKPGAHGRAVPVDDPDDAYSVVSRAATESRSDIRAFSIVFHVDLDATTRPADDDHTFATARSPVPDRELQLELPRDGAVMLVGPAAVRAAGGPSGDTVQGLHAFAGAARLGVVNTWGAKGVFPWDSPHHLGTAGLQALDFELLGFAGASLIVTTGIDRDESPNDRFALAPVADIHPLQLAAAAPLVRRDGAAELGGAATNALYTGMAAIAQPGYVDTSVPLHPARAVANARAVVPAGGVVAAEPGIAGLWFARTFPTSVLGSVVVPATRARGIAAALAFVASCRGRAALAVTTTLDSMTREIVELARVTGTNLSVDVWSRDTTIEGVDDHTDALSTALATPGVHVLSTPVATERTRDLVDVAGPVVAWGGIDIDR